MPFWLILFLNLFFGVFFRTEAFSSVNIFFLFSILFMRPLLVFVCSTCVNRMERGTEVFLSNVYMEVATVASSRILFVFFFQINFVVAGCVHL